jgi:hypothetical protein
LASTTRQWNPGDEFIMDGVRALLSPLLPPANWLMWDRNPDLFRAPWSNMAHRDGLIGNSIHAPVPGFVDMIVLGGSPEWTGASVAPLYEYLAENPAIPLLAVGVGSVDAHVELNEMERHVLDRPTSLVITRSEGLAKAVNSLLKAPRAKALPCPSIFCRTPLNGAAGEKVGMIVQTPNTGVHSKPGQFFDEAVKKIKSSHNKYEMIAFYSEEYAELARIFSVDDILYEMDSWKIFSIYSSFKALVSMRLHGALSAAVSGTPAFLISEANYRVESAAELVAPILPLLSIEDALRAAEEMTSQGISLHRRRVRRFQAKQRSIYDQMIRSFLNDLPN